MDPPKPVARRPDGPDIHPETITQAAQMLCGVTPLQNTVIRLISGRRDLMVSQNGYNAYGIAREMVPEDPDEQAREIRRRLAYGFHDWVVREIAGRYHHDLKQQPFIHNRPDVSRETTIHAETPG